MQRALQFRGMSFVDVIVGTALILIIFTALVGLLRTSLQVASLAKTRSIATAISESQMEYIRSLSYDAVGTLGGIPAGTIPQSSVITQNGIAFPVRTLIEYIDDPADGTGSSDSNNITTDYKRIKISVTFTVGNTTKSITLVSNYAPPGLETTTGGGTLKIVVVGASGTSIPGATVHITNASTTPTIDISTFSDTNGSVFLPGAPTSTQYQISVIKNGYSSAQTYARNATNQNPTPGYLTTVKNQTTTGTFAIDLLASLLVNTYLPITNASFSDSFTSNVNISSFNNTVLQSGAIQLTASSGYAPSGSVRSVPISPSYLYGWGTASATSSVPTGTALRFHITDSNGNVLPDTLLPGNVSGFTKTVNLSALSTSTYPSLSLSADLTTSDSSATPVLQSWSLSYQRGPIPLGQIPFILTGTKTIGSTGAGTPIIKTTVSTSTNSTGSIILPLEWDSYALSVASYDVSDICSAIPPYSIAPGSTSITSLMLSSSTPTMVLVSVKDANGPVSGATVTLSRSGFTKSVTTSACGGAYFSNLTSSTYSISAAKTGYTTFNASSIPISGHVLYSASLE